MAEKHTWVFIPQDAVSIQDCTFLDEKPTLQEMQGMVEGYIEPMPKVWNVKGVRTVYVNEAGAWNRDFKPNIIINAMIGQKKQYVMSTFGVVNMSNMFKGGNYHLSIIDKPYKGHMVGARGDSYQIVGPALAQIKESTLKEVIDGLVNVQYWMPMMDKARFEYTPLSQQRN